MRVIVAAGGTAGHINPALSLCQELKNSNPDNEILFIGTTDHMEAELVPKAGFNFKGIEMTGFERSLSPSALVYNAKTIIKLMRATKVCRKIIADFGPDAVVGFGGYVTGPVVRTAHKMGIKTAIHEQNAFPGKANIALAKYVDAVMLTSPDAGKHMECASTPVITGLPVRDEILNSDRTAARKNLGIPEDKKVILITGGSLGARPINDVICEIMPEYADNDNLLFVHGFGRMGKDVPDKLKSKGVDIENNPNLRVSEYIYNMGEYMAAADLMICRAGASTIAEVQVMGKTALFIPYPHAAENHQYYNALALADRNAGMLTEQKDFTADTVRMLIDTLISEPGKLIEMGENAKKMAITDAQKRICSIVTSL